MNPPALSVVVPCFNEREVLPQFHTRTSAACRLVGQTFEIVLVNDGSTDGTWGVMQELARCDPAIVLVNLSRNHGHQLALTAGLSICRGQRVLILDADLQDPPELLPEMWKVMDRGADVVYGLRAAREGETAFKRATASLFYRVIERLSDMPIPRDAGDFRLISRRALDVLIAMPERHRFLRGMVSWIGFRQEPFSYQRQPRHAGTTKYPVRRMVRLSLDAMTAFSIKPLALASILGICTGFFSLALLMFSVVAWWRQGTLPGWTSTMAGITLLGAVQLFVLGIIGSYLGRLYEQSKGRPLFIVERIVRSDDPVPPPESQQKRPAMGSIGVSGVEAAAIVQSEAPALKPVEPASPEGRS